MDVAGKKAETPAGLGDVRPSYLVDQVLSALKAALRTGTYKQGDKLPSEARLAAEFRVSRSTIREALRVLTHLGLVETWTGRGSFVAEPSTSEWPAAGAMPIGEAADIYHFRFTLEIEAAERAAMHRTPKQLATLKHLLARAKEGIATGDLDKTIVIDTDFHIGILEAGRCHFAASLYRANRSRIEAAARAVMSLIAVHSSQRAISSVQAIHDDLMDAIERQDAHGALLAVRRDQREVDTLLRYRSENLNQPSP
jgi:DNA-binding FadR family transcriptional regulator